MKADIGEIKADVKQNTRHISKIYIDVGVMKQQMTDHLETFDKLISGNGEGIITRIERHDKYIDEHIGQQKMWRYAMGGGWLVSLITAAIAVVKILL